MISYASY
ncbi:hypothetical protein D039_1087A, partial [Vibrio parahaemolyticus EKP-028]